MRSLFFCITAAAVIGTFAPAHAAFEVDSPTVSEGDIEIETKNRFDFDHRDDTDNYFEHSIGAGYAPNKWLKWDIETVFSKNPDDSYHWKETEVEISLELLEESAALPAIGLELGYAMGHESGRADELEFLLLAQRKAFGLTHTMNIGLEQEVGPHREEDAVLGFAWRSKYAISDTTEIGIEYHAEFGELGHIPGYSEQEHRIGPSLYGELLPQVGYEIGWLYGISRATEDHSFKIILEYEF